MCVDLLENYKDKKVKVVFHDGSNILVITGVINAISDDCIELLENSSDIKIIFRRAIDKIEPVPGGGGE